MNSTSKNLNAWRGVFFCIWPFATLYYALIGFRNGRRRWLLLLLFVFFGYTMNFNSTGKDGYRLGTKFENFETPSFEQFGRSIYYSLPFNSIERPDVYNYLVSTILSVFTNNQRWYFAFHSLIFGIFAIRLYGRVYDDYEIAEWKGGKFMSVVPFFLGIVFLNSITNVHGVRFPVASSIFLYGMYIIMKDRKLSNMSFILLAPLVHFSFVVPVILSYMYIVLGNRTYMYLAALILSYIFPNILFSLTGVVDFVDVGGLIEEKADIYSRADYVSSRKEFIEHTNWYKRYSIPLLKVSFLIVFYLSLIQVLPKSKDELFKNIFNFSILFLSFVNVGFAFDSLGRRFQMLWFIILSIAIIRYLQFHRNNRINLYSIIVAFPILLWTVLTLRVAMEYMSPVFLIGNPISALLTDINIVIIDIIK